jgi:ABC-type cobalamin/Fe3+-siderophores transport system ATPase subunit
VKEMPINLSIRQQKGGPLTVPLDDGQCIFVLGANGTGKSSLMHAFYTSNNANSRRISAHRQTWFSSNTLSLSPEQRRQTEQHMQGRDTHADSRWKDDYSAQRANIAIYDLIDAENVRARGIADAVDGDNISLAKELSKKDAPIKLINELLRQSSIPIEISVHQNEQVMASKSGGAPYSVAELSDGERNALLIAANVLTVPAGTLLLIDEPERHLHRSIISPLLTLLFQKRADCKFVVSTHDVLLPLDNPSARTILIRNCTYNGQTVAHWDVDVVPANAPVEDGVRKDILGSRRKVLFVEGDDKSSLDKPLYSLVFPNVSVVAKGGCREVETAVAGIRGAPDLHWVHAFGIVDNDRRTPADIASLQAAGVYAIAVYMVESVYYHPEIQRRVAERHAVVTGEDAATRVLEARNAALAAVGPHAARMSARAIEKMIRDRIDAMHPTQAQIAAGTPVNIVIDVAAELATEHTAFQALLAAQDVEGIICRYPVRETPALTHIANRLGFQDRGQYENAVRKLLMDDAVALTFVRNLFGTLYADVTA